MDESLHAALTRAGAAEQLLVASDYDGTLAPIVDDPDAAWPWPAAWEAFLRLGDMPGVEVALVSGRTRAMLQELTSSPGHVTLIGSHGLEAGVDTAPPREEVRRLVAAFEDLAASHAGAVVERKPAGAAFHYRRVAGGLAAQEARHAARRLGARVLDGKMVVEGLFGDADKGDAVRRLRDRTGSDVVVYFGDDTTDEHVFTSLRDVDVGVKVGPGDSAAGHRVSDPAGVADALTVLARARA